jgi:hypothetical protein
VTMDRADRRRRVSLIVVVALAAFGLLAACRSDHRRSPSPSASLRVCPTPPRAKAVVSLGGTGGALRGNALPVSATIVKGAVLEVSARFRERELSFPAADSNVLAALCSVRSAWTFSSYFRAIRVGVTQVIARTSTCGRCAQLGLAARITVDG